MSSFRDQVRRDVRAAAYLDALDAGDLQTIATLWDEASHDSELEHLLAEVDARVFVEEAQTPAVRPAEVPAPGAKPWLWLSVLGGVAAACALAIFLWPRPQPENPTRDQARTTHPAPPSPHPLAHAPADVARWQAPARMLSGAETTTFIWPVQGPPFRVGSAIPPDLLE
ncbi:MAG TPA: hypothetical protein VFA18_11970 [Gemmataceae bacterium]|nr:hypothetical protein [Gemmataceae bacterium]